MVDVKLKFVAGYEVEEGSNKKGLISSEVSA
jgi:hypothetical protein